MFVNPSLGEVFLVNSKTMIIHAASRLSAKCGIHEQENGRWGIVPADTSQERKFMIEQFQTEYPELSLCPHCFANELHLETKLTRELAADAEQAKDGAFRSEGAQNAG